LKWSRSRAVRVHWASAAGLGVVAGLIAISAQGDFPQWQQNAEAGTAIENALFRWMELPAGKVQMRRPPAEARPLLDELVKGQPNDAELLSLRAMSEEQQLDFDAAERDWKAYAQKAANRERAGFALADFYHRRARPTDEIAALSGVTQLPTSAAESLLAPQQQSPWIAFVRIFRVISANALPASVSDAQYRAWITRYPPESSLYGQYFEFLLEQKNYAGAEELLATYEKAFPDDTIFPVKARALLDYSKGDIAQGLAVYDQGFQPLWPADLIQGYFSLLQQTDGLRKFLDASRAAHAAHPDDLNAVARIFYYYQQEGKAGAAEEALEEYRAHKESTRTDWTGEELFTVAQLLEKIQAYPEAARYYASLYNTGNGNAAENRERALAGLIRILLETPDQPLALGARNLSIYKDIGSADPGPGFLNGILSLLFNSEDPKASFAEEEAKGTAYFHRAEAARLLAQLDTDFPKARERAGFHVELMQAYVEYGESNAVIRSGQKFLAAFSDSTERTKVSLLMADAYARQGKTEQEFAIYDEALRELGQKAQNVPLGYFGSAVQQGRSPVMNAQPSEDGAEDSDANDESDGQSTSENSSGGAARQSRPAPQAFQISQASPAESGGPRSAEYSQLLERYLSRLASLHQLPQALDVLRREVDRNPNDPGLYERLAQFLDDNKLGEQEEEVYQRAIQQFPDRSWYHKLARLYLRHKRDDEFEQLTETVTKSFAGSELESYFDDVMVSRGAIGPQLYLQLNLYTNRRFPHDLNFVRNLLSAYRRPQTYDEAAYMDLLGQHWFEDRGLRAEYFEKQNEMHQLDSELAELRAEDVDLQAGRWQQAAEKDPAAVEFDGEAAIWKSHYEEAAQPMGALAALYPADFEVGRRASALFRSLAYFEPEETEAAVGVEKNLLASAPGNRDTLARIGDIYADREMFAQAAPYWNRMTEIEPGNPNAYLEPATVFWDYFKFDDALRLLNDGRAKLHQPAEFAYQEGAIYENERDYSHAIDQYVRGALAEGESSQAFYRLLDLARRPKLKDAVDRATAHVADPSNPDLAFIRLRVKVLKAEDRKSEIRAFLLDEVERAGSIELAEGIEALAQQESLEDVRQHALEQQAKLTTDPVRRLELRYALVEFFESKKDFASAQANIEALYRENPKLLGVVRATVDFYWQRKMRRQAIGVLLQAAKDSYPELGDKFDFEAARKATDAGDFALARQHLDPLLKQSPYNGEYLAAMADTYAQAGDSAGLRDFYLAKIAEFRQAPLGADERKSRIAELRRGLIPALTQLKDFPGAVDQYIEILNQFPEDAGVTTEAALYAERHGLQSRLTAFYAKTSADSPRDYRWPMLLARLQTQFEDYPGAIASYSNAIRVRPDRADLYTARADLLERLMKFDEAANDYTKLYALTYHDPKYMVQVAKLRARQGNADAAVAALKTAYIEGRPASPQNFFDVAQSLESWGLLPQAADFAQQGVDAAGGDLLANPANHEGAQLYVRLLTRLRREQAAYARLELALGAAQAPVDLISSTVHQMEKEGLAAVTDAGWREHERQQRSAAGLEGMDACVKEMGKAVTQFFTPEEKVTFAEFLGSKRTANQAPPEYFIDAAQAAGLSDLEARWRFEALLAPSENPSGQLQSLIQLQTQRLKFMELGRELEEYADAARPQSRSYILQSAANAYRSEGADAEELRIYSELDERRMVLTNQERYIELLFELNRAKLVELASRPDSPLAEAAVNFAMASDDRQLAYQAIHARGSRFAPVWTNAYAALAGLYFTDSDKSVSGSFTKILDDRTIGERLGTKFDAMEQLSGNDWFYYGSRYGEYMGATHTGDPEDYLPAILEESPGTAAGYLVTGEYYADAKDYARAIADYNRSLELDADQPETLDRIAMLYEQQGQAERASDEWKKAFAILERQEQRRSVPESFYLDFASIAEHLKKEKLAAAFRPEMDTLLRAYIRHNGDYNTMPLLHAAYDSLGDSATSASWLLDLASAAPDQDSLVNQFIDAQWISPGLREPFYRRIIELRQANLDKAPDSEKDSAQTEVYRWQVNWLEFLVRTNQLQRAKGGIEALPEEARRQFNDPLARVALRIAAHFQTLDATLAGYRKDPEQAPSLDSLRRAADDLAAAGDKPSARKVLEYAYTRELERHNLTAPNFLGLAEVRLQSGDTRGALELLHRLALVVGAPFENLDAAAALLEKNGHPGEAATFLAQLSKAEPWQAEIRLRLARAQIAAGQNPTATWRSLVALASDAEIPYGVREEAALSPAGHVPGTNLGSGELTLLASGKPALPTAANQPYYLQARLAAASHSKPGERIPLLRAALEDAPFFEAARIQLIHAATGAHDYALANSAAQPIVNSGLFTNEGVQPQNDALQGFDDSKENDAVSDTSDDADSDENQSTEDNSADQSAAHDDSTDQNEPQSDVPVSSSLSHSASERVHLAMDMATISENLNQLNDAVRYLEFAQTLERRHAVRGENERRLAQLRAEIKRRATNAVRRPVIHRQLEQDRIVRPEIPASAETPANQGKPAGSSAPKAPASSTIAENAPPRFAASERNRP
jgi:cellulose synthase operon protein C